MRIDRQFDVARIQWRRQMVTIGPEKESKIIVEIKFQNFERNWLMWDVEKQSEAGMKIVSKTLAEFIISGDHGRSLLQISHK